MSKKKSTIKKAPVESVVEQPIDPTPPEEVPSVQLEEPVQTELEPVAEVESTRFAEPEKSAEVEPTIVEPPVDNEPPHIPVLGPKPKNLTMAYLQEEIDYLMALDALRIYQNSQKSETIARKRNPPNSNGKIQMLDKVSGRTYPSKNNLYLSLLKAGELTELVEKGLFGPNPEKNTFGVFSLLRAWPTRFQPIQSQETNVT